MLQGGEGANECGKYSKGQAGLGRGQRGNSNLEDRIMASDTQSEDDEVPGYSRKSFPTGGI